jgi:peptidoglycan/LPS O-acetylase OafA/YrhL
VVPGPGSQPAPGPYAGRMRTAAAVFLDLCCVMAFVLIGRAGHSEGETIAGIATTAWPFLSGLLIGWAVTRGWRRPTALARTGLGVWLVTVAAGMALRAVSGQGVAVAFVLVALAFLGLFMLGWRAVAKLGGRGRRTGQ